MRSATIVLALLFGFASCVPMEQGQQVEPLNTDVGVRNTPLETLVLDILEQVRGIMVTGADNVPILDPLTINKGRLDLGVFGLNKYLFNFRQHGHIAVTGFDLNKLSTFEIDKLSITSFLLRYTVEVEAHIPVLDFTSENYDLDVTLVGFNLYGNGEASGRITGPRVKATIVVSPRISLSGLFIQINSANVEVAVDTFEPKLAGIFGNEPATDFINRFLENLIPEFLEYFKEDISAIVNSIVVEYGNEILKDFNLAGILGRDNVEKILAPSAAETSDNMRCEGVKLLK